MLPAPDTLARRRDGLITESVLDDVVVLDPATSRYVRLNATAGTLWAALDASPATVAELAAVLVEQRGAPQDRALDDARSFVAAMAERRLIEVAPTS